MSVSSPQRVQCRRFSGRRRLDGSVIVEMAVCLPVMLLLVFGCLELNSSIFLSQTLTSAAHEGALIGSGHGATEADVIDRVEAVLKARNVDEFTLEVRTFGAADFDQLLPGERFAVAIGTPRANRFVDLSQIDVEVSALRP